MSRALTKDKEKVSYWNSLILLCMVDSQYGSFEARAKMAFKEVVC